MATPGDWLETNRRNWDERVPIHVRSDFYGVRAFKEGRPALEPFEIDELGPLGGLRIAHLQCHFGLDTLDLVRLHPALEAVGLDFSAPAINEATELARELGLDGRARFVHGEVHNACELLGRASFDVVYTGKGALCWLPDLRSWAGECAGLLRPGGRLYVCEFHPVGFCLDEDRPAIKYDYFDTAPIAEESSGTYADRAASTVNNLCYQWQHPLPQLFDALGGAGFVVRFFHEWDYAVSDITSWLVRGDDGRYRWPAKAKLPLMYSLRAEKPG